MGENAPCNKPGPWIPSVSLCEWHAPGEPRDGLAELFVSISSAGIDSAVLWGAESLNTAVWNCEIVHARKTATICVPKSLEASRRKTFLREWRVTLAEITRPGDESTAKPQPEEN
jgi:hypothetical protein